MVSHQLLLEGCKNSIQILKLMKHYKIQAKFEFGGNSPTFDWVLALFCRRFRLMQKLYSLFSSPEPKAQGELIVWDLSRRPCVHACVRASMRRSTLSNINISETSEPIIIKFHQKHYWGGGLTVLGFQLDRIRTLISMATDSSHRVIMGKFLWPL